MAADSVTSVPNSHISFFSPYNIAESILPIIYLYLLGRKLAEIGDLGCCCCFCCDNQ